MSFLERVCFYVFFFDCSGEPCLSDPSAHVVLVPGAARWRELIRSGQGQPPPRPAGPLLLGSWACGARRCSMATVLPPLCPTKKLISGFRSTHPGSLGGAPLGTFVTSAKTLFPCKVPFSGFRWTRIWGPAFNSPRPQ